MKDLILNRRLLIVDDTAAVRRDYEKVFASVSPIKQSRRDVLRDELFGPPSSSDSPASGPSTADISFHLDFASQGMEAVEMVSRSKDHPYSVAFVDVRMPPGIDGVETTQKIWQHDHRIQVVLCTAYSDFSWADIISMCGNPENIIILKKPFEAIEVLQMANALSEKWSLMEHGRRKLAEVRKNLESIPFEPGETDRGESYLHLQERLAAFQALIDPRIG